MITICAVPPDMARAAVEFVGPLLMKAREYGDRGAHGWRRRTSDPSTYPTIEEIIADVERRHAVLWVVMDGAGFIAAWITRIKIDDARRKVVEVGILGGERGAEWFTKIRSRMHEFRKAEGAELLIWTGRKAWRRVFGIEPVGVAENGLWIYEDFG